MKKWMKVSIVLSLSMAIWLGSALPVWAAASGAYFKNLSYSIDGQEGYLGGELVLDSPIDITNVQIVDGQNQTVRTVGTECGEGSDGQYHCEIWSVTSEVYDELRLTWNGLQSIPLYPDADFRYVNLIYYLEDYTGEFTPWVDVYEEIGGRYMNVPAEVAVDEAHPQYIKIFDELDDHTLVVIQTEEAIYIDDSYQTATSGTAYTLSSGSGSIRVELPSEYLWTPTLYVIPKDEQGRELPSISYTEGVKLPTRYTYDVIAYGSGDVYGEVFYLIAKDIELTEGEVTVQFDPVPVSFELESEPSHWLVYISTGMRVPQYVVSRDMNTVFVQDGQLNELSFLYCEDVWEGGMAGCMDYEVKIPAGAETVAMDRNFHFDFQLNPFVITLPEGPTYEDIILQLSFVELEHPYITDGYGNTVKPIVNEGPVVIDAGFFEIIALRIGTMKLQHTDFDWPFEVNVVAGTTGYVFMNLVEMLEGHDQFGMYELEFVLGTEHNELPLTVPDRSKYFFLLEQTGMDARLESAGLDTQSSIMITDIQHVLQQGEGEFWADDSIPQRTLLRLLLSQVDPVQLERAMTMPNLPDPYPIVTD